MQECYLKISTKKLYNINQWNIFSTISSNLRCKNSTAMLAEKNISAAFT